MLYKMELPNNCVAYVNDGMLELINEKIFEYLKRQSPYIMEDKTGKVSYEYPKMKEVSAYEDFIIMLDYLDTPL